MTPIQAIFLCASFVFSSISIIVAHRSNCRVEEYRVQKQFDPQKFSGRWYAYKYLPSRIFPSPLPLQDLVFTFIQSDNRTYSTYTTSRQNSSSACNTFEGKMDIKYAGTNMSAKMEFMMDTASNETLQFWVLETDYTNYAVAYGCLSALDTTTGFCPDNEVNGWAFARYVWEPLTAYVDWRIDHRLDYFCSNVSHYEMIVHNKERCRFPESMFWLPQPAFNITRLVGMWYEQELIPLDENRVPRIEADQNVLVSIELTENGTIDLSRSARKAMNNSDCFTLPRYLETTDVPGKFILRMKPDDEGVDLTVAFTDYTECIFTVGCVDKPLDQSSPCREYHSWIGSRYANASGRCGLWLQRLMALHDIDDRLYYTTIQNHTCNYMPPPPPPPPPATTPAPQKCPGESNDGSAPLYMHQTLILMTAAIVTLMWKEM